MANMARFCLAHTLRLRSTYPGRKRSGNSHRYRLPSTVSSRYLDISTIRLVISLTPLPRLKCPLVKSLKGASTSLPYTKEPMNASSTFSVCSVPSTVNLKAEAIRHEPAHQFRCPAGTGALDCKWYYSRRSGDSLPEVRRLSCSFIINVPRFMGTSFHRIGNALGRYHKGAFSSR